MKGEDSQNKPKNAYEQIYEVVRAIPKGKVASYGQVAELAGNRRWVRVVGYALHALPHGSDIPWHRVVKKDGTPLPVQDADGENVQFKLLEEEGIECVNGRVDMKQFQWEKRRI